LGVGVVGAGSSVVVVVIVVVEGLGEGAAVVDVEVDVVGDWVGDGEEAAVVMMVGVLVVGVVALDVVLVAVVVGVEAGAESESVVVPAGGGSVPLFMFSNSVPDKTKMISAAALYEVIQLRDGTRPVWPSCLTSHDQWWRGKSTQSEKGSRA
jgi:hypothetical protein